MSNATPQELGVLAKLVIVLAIVLIVAGDKSSLSSAVSTMISWINIRMIFLRVSTLTPGLFQASVRSAPNVSSRSRSSAATKPTGRADIWAS